MDSPCSILCLVVTSSLQAQRSEGSSGEPSTHASGCWLALNSRCLRAGAPAWQCVDGRFDRQAQGGCQWAARQR